MTLTLSKLALSMVAGSLTTLSPCVLPILPIVVGGALQANRFGPAAMGAGLMTMFAAVGLVAGAFGNSLGFDSDLFHTAGAVLLIAFGMITLIPSWSGHLARLMAPLSSVADGASRRIEGRSLVGAFWLGALLGMVWSPCSGPLLASALTLVATQGSAGRGALILGTFGLGAALPLVAIAYLSRTGLSRVMSIAQGTVAVFKKVFGILLVVLGVAILTGADKHLEALLTDQLPDAWLTLTSRF